MFCAIIASCYEMDVYPWLNQDSLNSVFHFRSRRWGKWLYVRRSTTYRNFIMKLSKDSDIYTNMICGWRHGGGGKCSLSGEVTVTPEPAIQ